jgi:hypothetical protein
MGIRDSGLGENYARSDKGVVVVENLYLLMLQEEQRIIDSVKSHPERVQELRAFFARACRNHSRLRFAIAQPRVEILDIAGARTKAKLDTPDGERVQVLIATKLRIAGVKIDRETEERHGSIQFRCNAEATGTAARYSDGKYADFEYSAANFSDGEQDMTYDP